MYNSLLLQREEAGKPHGCNVCGERFMKASHLNSHYRFHTGEKPYQCNTCYKFFVTSLDLVTHSQIYHTISRERQHLRTTDDLQLYNRTKQ